MRSLLPARPATRLPPAQPSCPTPAIRHGIAALMLGLALAQPALALPEGFVYVDQVVPHLVQDIRYGTAHNFVGQPINGYQRPRAILTRAAANALAAVVKDLEPFGLGIKIFDAYRPQRAVEHFIRWAADPNALAGKQEFYPRVDKLDLLLKGYIAEKSGHSRGSTVDLTLVDLKEGTELAMGTPFDFFGPESAPDYPEVSATVRANRALLRAAMGRRGFRPLAEEWWHFTLEQEPFPDKYFDFPVE